jgi:tetratricopeptide (TPR) repeat protein
MPERRQRSRRAWWIAAIVAALVGSGAALWWRQNRRLAALLAEGISAYAQGDWDRSALLARERLKVAADDPEALRLSARSAARQNRDQQAIAIYSRLELRLMTAEDYFLLGRSLSRTGQDDLALKALEASRDAEPDRLEMLDELAQVYFRKDRPAAAQAIAERLIHQPRREARSQLMLGTFRAVLNDPTGSARALRRGFELDPEGKTISPQPARPLRMLLIRSLLQAGEPSEARRYSSVDAGITIRLRIRLAREPLLPSGESMEGGRPGARLSGVVSPRPSSRARTGPLRGRGPVRCLPSLHL